MTGHALSCPKCGAYSGDDWSQCNGPCPMTMSPNYDPIFAAQYETVEPPVVPPEAYES